MFGLPLLLTPTAAPGSSLLSGLGGYWKLDGNSNDVLGTSNGTDTGSTYTTGKISQGATFSAAGNIDVGLNAALKPTTAMSIAAWVKWNSFVGNSRIISDWHQSAALNRFIFPYESSGTGAVAVVFCNASGISTVLPSLALGLSGGVVVTGVWYHFVATYDGATVGTYRNGAAVDTAALSGAMNAGTGGHVRFGTQQEFGNTFDGVLDEVGIWSRALTLIEIQSLYSAGAGMQYPF